MRFFHALLCLALLTVAGAAPQSDRGGVFGCTVNLPDSGGWVQVEHASLPKLPGMTVLMMTQNAQKQAVFAVSVIHDLPSNSLTDPATLAALEKTLVGFGYELRGSSTAAIAGRSWRQYPVFSKNNGAPVSGVIRYTNANNHVFGVTLLRNGDGAAQDVEMQTAGASIRFTPPAIQVAATKPGTAPVLNPAAIPAAERSPGAAPAGAPVPASTEKTFTIGSLVLTMDQVKMIGMVTAGLIILVIFLMIITGGKKDKMPPPPTGRRF